MSKKTNQILLRTLVIVVILFSLDLFNTVFAQELQLETKSNNEKYIEWLELSEEEQKKVVTPAVYVKSIQDNVKNLGESFKQRIVGASSSFNLRNSINLKVKNQMQTEQCWAFATTTQLESYMALKKNKSVEYSPRHMEYSTAKTFTDGTNPFGFNRSVNSGGNSFLAYSYMASGLGPVLETDMPFVNTTRLISLSEIQNKTVQAQLKEFIMFPSIYKEKSGNSIIYSNGQTGDNRVEYTQTQVVNLRNQIKNHIIKYGSVTGTTATNNNEFFSNPNQPSLSYAYYCDNPNVQADHAVSIIGWDDNYAVSNFNEDHRPQRPGAWIIQNSYGDEVTDSLGNKATVFDNGLLYISYEDFIIEQLLTGIIEVDDVSYDKIYQYDPLGVKNAVSIPGLNEIYAANVFEKDVGTEYLTQIGIYTGGNENQTYEIYVNSQDGNLNNLIKVKSVGKTNSDYITIELDKPIKLTGENFVVAIKYMNSAGNAEIPVEAKLTYEWNDLWGTASSNLGESFWMYDKNTSWKDFKNENIPGISNINVCIKAFTKNQIEQDEEIFITSNLYTINSNTIINVSPNTNIINFKNNINTNGTIKIYDNTGNEVSSVNSIGTGMKIKIIETNDEYVIAVKGDVNGDGKITATDLLKIKKDIVKIQELKGIYKTAGDINNTNSITSTDLLKIKKAICHIIEL